MLELGFFPLQQSTCSKAEAVQREDQLREFHRSSTPSNPIETQFLSFTLEMAFPPKPVHVINTCYQNNSYSCRSICSFKSTLSLFSTVLLKFNERGNFVFLPILVKSGLGITTSMSSHSGRMGVLFFTISTISYTSPLTNQALNRPTYR